MKFLHSASDRTVPSAADQAQPDVLGNQSLQRMLSRHRVQTKLTVNRPNDTFEQEADRVADQVMRMPDPVGSLNSLANPPKIQRLCSECRDEMQRQPIEEEEETLQAQAIGASASFDPSRSGNREDVLRRQSIEEEEETPEVQRERIGIEDERVEREALPEEEEEEPPVQAKEVPGRQPTVSADAASQIHTLRGGGQPMSPSTRQMFESRFGRDFSGVRVHTGPQASSLARSINARAFTRGSDVVFGAGEYQPGTPAGRQLLAHELTHVVQQGQADPAAVSGRATLEAEADRSASTVSEGGSFQPRHTASKARPLTAPVATGPGQVEVLGDRFILNNFDIERATMKPEWLPTLLAIGLILNLDPSKEVEIEGHTDSTGTPGINGPLSLNRAQTIQSFLTPLVLENAVVSPILIGHGSNVPIASNATPAGRARNRRVEIRIVDRPLPDILRVDLLNSAAAQTFVTPSVLPLPAFTHGVTVAQEPGSDARVQAVLSFPLAPGDRRLELFSWLGATQDPGNLLEADITRGAGENRGTVILSTPSNPLVDLGQFTVWSVGANLAGSGVPVISSVSNAAGFGRRATINFTAAITPGSVITGIDRPDLTGANTIAPPDSGIHLCGSALAGGADHRWDITRRFRQRVLNPAGLARRPPATACFWTNQLVFPGNTAEGNDDTHTGDETNDPYANGGVLTSVDTPADFVRHAQGSAFDTLEIRMHFQEFARLQLGGRWRSISPPLPWRFHWKAIKLPLFGVWVDDNSNTALDNAGF